MKSKMTPKHKAMAYILNKDMGYTMESVSNLMEVSQSTISKGIRDFQIEMTIRNLKDELEKARIQLASMGYIQDPNDILPPKQSIKYIESNFKELL